jgi:hypothetical protein
MYQGVVMSRNVGSCFVPIAGVLVYLTLLSLAQSDLFRGVLPLSEKPNPA